MIIGESSRPDEMVVNPARTKELTNIRTHAHDEAVRLAPASGRPWRPESNGSPTTNW